MFKIKKEQIKEKVEDFWYDVKHFISEKKWYILHRTTKQYHNVSTGLKPGYYDPDTRLLNCCYNELKTFIEWHQKSNREPKADLYKEINAPNMYTEYEKMKTLLNKWTQIKHDLEHCYDNSPKINEPFFTRDPESSGHVKLTWLNDPVYSKWLKEVGNREDQLVIQERQCMKDLVDLLPFMWY